MIIAPDDPGSDELGQMLEVTVTRVFDGDGFLASVWHPRQGRWLDEQPFRFAFIDAPEMEQPLGSDAQAFLQELIFAKSLRLDPIGKASKGYNPIDQHKRMLCMGYLTEEMPVGKIDYYFGGKCSTGTARSARNVTRNVELEMIVNGFAWVLPQYAFDDEERYIKAQENARNARRGLWEQDNPEPPWKFKQRQKREKAARRDQPRLF